MEETFKILAFDALSLARRLREVDASRFLNFIDRSCTEEDAAAIRSLVGGVVRKTAKRSSDKRVGTEQDVYAREIRAILSDVEFIPTKRELLLMVASVVGDVPSSLVKKGSRDAVIDWAVRKISDQPSSTRQMKYRAIRQIFLKKRDSSLRDWAEILAKPAE